MPRITNIHISRKSNLGNYEAFEFSADAVIAEDESVSEATTVLQEYVDWHSRKPIRDGQRLEHLRRAVDDSVTANEKTRSNNWLAKYDAMQAKMELI